MEVGPRSSNLLFKGEVYIFWKYFMSFIYMLETLFRPSCSVQALGDIKRLWSSPVKKWSVDRFCYSRSVPPVAHGRSADLGVTWHPPPITPCSCWRHGTRWSTFLVKTPTGGDRCFKALSKHRVTIKLRSPRERVGPSRVCVADGSSQHPAPSSGKALLHDT